MTSYRLGQLWFDRTTEILQKYFHKKPIVERHSSKALKEAAAFDE
ncbi:hypothetical protein [Spirosoma sp.]